MTPLKAVLEEEGRKQSWLSERTGIPQPRLSQIVNGHWNADEPTRAAIAAALGRHVDELWPDADQAAAA